MPLAVFCAVIALAAAPDDPTLTVAGARPMRNDAMQVPTSALPASSSPLANESTIMGVDFGAGPGALKKSVMKFDVEKITDDEVQYTVTPVQPNRFTEVSFTFVRGKLWTVRLVVNPGFSPQKIVDQLIDAYGTPQERRDSVGMLLVTWKAGTRVVIAELKQTGDNVITHADTRFAPGAKKSVTR
jgi:hypothetical protein